MKKNINDLTIDMARNYANALIGKFDGYEAYAEFEDIIKAYINGANETRTVLISEIMSWINENCSDTELASKICNHLNEYIKCHG